MTSPVLPRWHSSSWAGRVGADQRNDPRFHSSEGTIHLALCVCVQLLLCRCVWCKYGRSVCVWEQEHILFVHATHSRLVGQRASRWFSCPLLPSLGSCGLQMLTPHPLFYIGIFTWWATSPDLDVFKDRISQWPWSYRLASWQTKSSRDLPFAVLPSLPSIKCWGSEIRSLSFQSKYFTTESLTTTPSPLLTVSLRCLLEMA